jgi:hypothetical protein
MVSDRFDTESHLIKDLNEARRKIAELERLLAEKSRAEEALREAEERYRALFEQAADNIMVFDPETLAPVAFKRHSCNSWKLVRPVSTGLFAFQIASYAFSVYALRASNCISSGCFIIFVHT